MIPPAKGLAWKSIGQPSAFHGRIGDDRMLAITGLLGLTLLGGEPTKSVDSSALVKLQVRIVDLKGLGWRGPIHQELKPEGRHGAVSVWTTDRNTANAIQNVSHNTFQAPDVSVNNGASAKICNETRKNYVADLERVANGPQGKNTHLAFHPEIDSARDGISAELTCKASADGIEIAGVIDESRILAIHTYQIADSVIDPKTEKVAQRVNAQAQVPEIATCRVEGNWTVPNGRVLVISLGARSSAYQEGKAAVSERVLLIEPTALIPAQTGAIRASSEVLAAWVAANRTPKTKPGKPFPVLSPVPDLRSVNTPTLPVPTLVGAASSSFVPRLQVPFDPKNVCVLAEEDHAHGIQPTRDSGVCSAPIIPALVSSLASPTVAPHPGWKASVRIEAGVALPSAPEDGVMAVLPLSMTHLPFAFPMSWIGFAIEPNRGDEQAPLKQPTPPSRNIMIVDSNVAAPPEDPSSIETADSTLPPLPDDFVHPASGEVLPSPQIPHVQAAKRVDSTIVRTAVQVGSTLPFRFNRSEDVVLFPAPKAIDEDDCPEHVAQRVTRSEFSGCSIQPSFPMSVENVTDARKRLTKLKLFASQPVAIPSDENATRTEFVPFPIHKTDDILTPPHERAKTLTSSSLSFTLKGEDGVCESNSEIRLKAIEAQPVTLRLPMADGSIVEIQARVIKR